MKTAPETLANKIITVCEYLKTDYVSKKHGGYNIYRDDKIILETDTYVPNTCAKVILPNNMIEYVFSASYSGQISCYHTGKWEEYLDQLYQKAIAIQMQKEKERIEEEIEEEEKAKKIKEAPASEEANKVFEN